MPPATLPKSSTPISALSSVATNNTTMAVQSGPYTKTQFQSTMEGSRTIKSSKEVEQLLRDYPAALELYRTGKYKVKVKCEADVERVILVEKRTPKVTSTNSSAANDINEPNQTVPDISTTTEPDRDTKKDRSPRRSRSPTQYQDRVAPTTTTVSQSGNIVHTTISSIRMTSNTQPKVDHQRGHSKERETSVTPQQKQSDNHRSHSRESQRKASYSKQQNNKISREYPKMMIPFVPNATNPGNLWQQQRPVQPYFSNPLLQQQQQQRSNLFMTPSFVPQQNPIYRQPYYYGQQPSAHAVYQQSQQQPPYPPLSVSTVGKTKLHSTHNYATSSRSASNTMGLPPSFRTFHTNQQPQHATLRPMYQGQVPFPFNPQWNNMANPQMANMIANNMYVDQKRGARDRARSVDTGGRNHPSMRLPQMFPQQQQQQQQPPLQPPVPMMESKVHHHHHRHRSHHTGQSVTNNKEQQNATPKEPPLVGTGEKLTVRQLNEIFMQMDPTGRLPYSSMPTVLQRFSIALTENDVTSAAKELGYNLNEAISARRLVHILVKLGKITKSNQQQQQQQQRQPVSPSMLPEDREVTDIMTQRKSKATHSESSTQPNQWN